MKKLRTLYKKYEEIIHYLIIGVATTFVSLAVYFICVHTFLDAKNPLELQIANIISWIISVAFAYITNRIFVFKSKSKEYIKEIINFFISRLLTLAMDMGIMFLFVSIINIEDTIAKLISQIVVILANYILSKVFVFKKKDSK